VFIAVEEPETSSGRRLQRVVSKGIVASHIAWDSAPVTTTADQALAAASAGTTAQALGEAVEFLLDELAAGPRAVREIKTSAVGAGIAWRTVRRAQQKLEIKPLKAGLKEGRQWSLPKEGGPEKDDNEPEDDHPLAEDVQP
jgi:putative DNA primase/helicase